jgi:CDP-diacylglycerol--serine O-phosphatidyltransferase
MRLPKNTVPMIFTMGALAAGFLSLVAAAGGEYLQSAQLILLSMVLDGLDGKLARSLKATSSIGAELDTFVDFASFGIAPALLAYQMALKSFEYVGTALAVFLVISGGYRLSRFRVIDPARGGRGFTGLPITVAGGWIALWAYLEASGALEAYGFSLARGPLSAFVWSCTLLFAILQVSRVRYAKVTGDAVVFAGGVLLIAALFVGIRIGPAAALALAAYGFYFAVFSPIIHPPPRPRATPEAEDLAALSDEAEEISAEEEDHPVIPR